MKTFKTMAAALAVLCLGAGMAMAQLSDAYKNWDDTAVQFLMTADEKAAFKKLKSDADAETFIELFWARRDPTPGTPRNEWKEMFEKRVALADESFDEPRTKGSLTDRGRIFLLLGTPTSMSATGAQTRAGMADMGNLGDSPTILWRYEAPTIDTGKLEECKGSYGDAICRLFMINRGVPPFATTRDFEVSFSDLNSTNDFRLTQGRRGDLPALLRKAQEFYLFQPDLVEPPSAQLIAQATVPASEIQPATSFSSKELEAAYREFRAQETSPYSNVYVSYGEYVTASGDYFVPVQLYMPKSDALAANQQMSFFGVIENAAGDVVTVFEEPITLAESKSAVYVDKSLELPPGEYRGTFGLAVANKPVTIASTKISLSGLDASKPGISPLLLSDNVFPLSEAQLPTDPFAFGGIKVVPKGDRTFTTADELWYFFELRNPGVAPTSIPATKTETTVTGPGTSTSITTPAQVAGPDLPKIQVGVDVTGKLVDGKTKKMRSPLMGVDAQELKGVPGHYAVGNAIPLETFPPGDYTIEVKVLDTINKQSWVLKENFKVVEQI
jgi:GWxTD domain-containing protein